MITTGQIHVGDVGTVFEATIINETKAIVSLILATTLRMTFEKPNGTTFVRTAVVSTDGQDGKMRYVSVAGDLDQAGNWHVQAYVLFSNGEWHASIIQFVVAPNL